MLVQQSKNMTTLAYTLNSSRTKYYGIVLQKKSNKECVPHEIGHALGLDDIYDNKKIKFNNIPSINDLAEDYTGELNYYNVHLATIILNLLMNGVEENNSLFIIPLGTIRGEIECRKDNESPIGIIKVGIMNLINNIFTEGIKNAD